MWEGFFNNQLAQQLQQQALPLYKEIVAVQQAPLPVVEEELLHSNNTSNVSLVSSHSGIIVQEEREE